MTIIKTCKIHGDLTEENVKQGIYKGKKYKKCRLCEIERVRKYYARMYENEEFIIQKRQKDRDRWGSKKEEIKRSRQTPKAVEKRKKTNKKFYEAHREYYLSKQKKYREELHDCYVKKAIQNKNKNIKFSDITKGMVDLKRVLLQIKKEINVQKMENKNQDETEN